MAVGAHILFPPLLVLDFHLPFLALLPYQLLRCRGLKFVRDGWLQIRQLKRQVPGIRGMIQLICLGKYEISVPNSVRAKHGWALIVGAVHAAEGASVVCGRQKRVSGGEGWTVYAWTHQTASYDFWRWAWRKASGG